MLVCPSIRPSRVFLIAEIDQKCSENITLSWPKVDLFEPQIGPSELQVGAHEPQGVNFGTSYTTVCQQGAFGKLLEIVNPPLYPVP